MSYALVEVEITRPHGDLRLGDHHDGVGIISRRDGRVVGFSIHPVAPGTHLSAGRLAAMLDPAPVAPDGPPPGGPRPRVTVAVCTRDRPELLRTCLTSLLDGDVRPVELLVVDNAPSDDRTRQLVAELGLRYVRESRPGLDFARNVALRSASGDVVAFVDDDVVVDADWLARIEAVWRTEPETGAVTGQILPLELATDAQVAFERRGGFRGGNARVRYAGSSLPGDPVYPYGPGMFGAGANMAVHRATALRLGAFDEALDTGPPLPGGGDIDMLHRVVRHGHPLVYEPRAVVFHRHRRRDEELLRQYRSWGLSLMAFAVKTYRVDPAGRPKLRRLIRWFFATQVRSVVVGDADERRAAATELAGGVVGLLGAYGRSQRRTARIRDAAAGPGGAPARGDLPATPPAVSRPPPTPAGDGSTVEPLPVSVVIPTIGRVELLGQCLRSVLACVPTAADVVVVDQSHAAGVEDLVRALGAPQVRRLDCAGRGIALAMNEGLAAAAHDTVLVTHDDCVVAADWVAVAQRLAGRHPGAIITGRVLPPDGSGYVPSTKTDPTPRDFTGVVTSGVLFPADMVASRRELQAIGGFDERPGFRVAAEDNDLCYRWLADGRALRYEPDLVVWHHDWRTPEQLVRTHVGYARAQGAFYAKHVRAGDRRIVPLLRWDLRHGLRSVVVGTLRRTPRWQDPYREMVGSLLVGGVAGWREDRRLQRERSSASG